MAVSGEAGVKKAKGGAKSFSGMLGRAALEGNAEARAKETVAKMRVRSET